MGGGVEQHAFQGQPLLGLLIGLLGDPHAGSGEPLSQLVPDQLKLSQVKHPRLGEPLRWQLQATHGIGGDEGVGQLALQTGDLAPEAPPSGALSRLADALAQRWGWTRMRVRPGLGKLHCSHCRDLSNPLRVWARLSGHQRSASRQVHSASST
jgi:hypothetical protein